MAVILAVIAALLAGVPSKAHADASTGAGGLFVSQVGELWNSGDGAGGAPTGALTANHWYTVGVDGDASIPSSGVSAVTVTFTVSSPAAAGIIHADKTGVTTPNTTVSYLDYVAGGTSSGTGTIAVGSDGNIQIDTTAAATIKIDVTGYYTSGATAPGGYVPVQGSSVENVAAVPTGGNATVFSVGGTNSVPMGSSAVMLSVIEGNPTGSNGSLTVYPDGPNRPSVGLSWPSTRNYEWTTSVALPANGKIDLYVNSGGPVDTSVSVIGYFTPTNGTAVAGQFTPGAARVYDSRSPSSPIAAAATRTIQVTGVNGVPAASSAITSVAINLQIVAGSTSSGHIQAYADNAPPGANAQQFYYATTSSAYVVVPLGPDGGIKIQNSANAAINVVVDVEGWYSSSSGTLQSGPTTTGMTGSRPSATNLSFAVSDEVQAKVDVATGNLLVATGGLSLPGVTATTSIGAAYNSQSQVSYDSSAGLDSRWIGNFDGAGELSTNTAGVVWTGPDGSTWQFTAAPSTGYGDYTSPAGLHDILTSTPTGYNLLSLTSRTVITFDTSGNAQTVVDKDGNTVTLGYQAGYGLETVTSTAGPTAMRVANIGFDGDNNTYYFSQYDTNNHYRDIEYGTDANGNISSYTDADGAVTTFGYSGNDLTSITSPTGAVTNISYVSGTDKVAEVDQLNTTAGSPGTSTTRLAYTSSTQTLVAGPDTSTAVTVASGLHTMYTINGSESVTAVTDAAGRTQSTSYTNMSNAYAPTSSTVGSNGSSNAAYGANSGQSATSVTSPTGNASSATYGSSQSSAYLPASTTDGSGTKVTTGYDGSGNALSTTTGSSGPTSTLTYNPNGTVATATSPKNTTGTSPNQVFNATHYAYNSTNQLSTVTAPTGNTLGVKTYTYDPYGRLATETDGAGHTTSYTYDNDDRLLTTSFSDGTGTVTDAYDASGHELSEASASGTVHNIYDQLGHLISTTNSGGGGYEQFTYDKAGSQLTSSSQNGGTDTNTYDASGVLTQTAYPTSSGTGYLDYYVNANGVRTDEWSGASQTWNPSPTTASTPGTWTDHINTTYDASNRVTELKAYDGTNTSPSLVYDTKYCFATTTTGSTTCATGTAALTVDTNKIQWAENMITNQLTDYTYTSGRLTKAVQSGGTTNNTYIYGYDTDGNRTSAVVEFTGSTTATTSQTFTFNSADQISNTGYTYDGDGNLTASPTATYTYNGAEQMTTAVIGGVTTSYTYEGASQNEVLTQSTTGGAAYTSTYGQGGQLVAYQDATGDASTIFSDPVNGQAAILSAGGQTGLFIDDGLDNPVGLVGAGTGTAGEDSAETYDPYGLTNYTAGDADNAAPVNPYQFKNGIQDRATGLVKFGQRWYNPIDGTWTQRDTLDAPLDPLNADRYEFAGDDPINGADASGNIFLSLTLEACLGICLSAGVDIGDGGLRPTIGAGVGPSAGTEGAATVSPGSSAEGASEGIECTAGGVTGGVDTDGSDTSGNAGVTTATEAGCEGHVNYTA